jgi:hypothetical protein
MEGAYLLNLTTIKYPFPSESHPSPNHTILMDFKEVGFRDGT